MFSIAVNTENEQATGLCFTELRQQSTRLVGEHPPTPEKTKNKKMHRKDSFEDTGLRREALEQAQYICQQHGHMGGSLLASEKTESTFIFNPLTTHLLCGSQLDTRTPSTA
ncbi:hypothetical protein STEG23_002995 [Scotinomys teguina]